METLKGILEKHTREGELSQPLENGWIRCVACGHRCKIAPGREGICKVRFNRNGTLMVPFGYVSALHADPIEKKPFFHAFPGSNALSFGMLGCDYHCAYCQNWYTSQSLRDPAAAGTLHSISPESIVDTALRQNIPVITSTYNEPLITSEWAGEVFRLATLHGIVCSYVSNGNGTPEVLEYLRPHLRLMKIDLKSFRQRSYQQLGGRLTAVLDTINAVVRMGIWVEVVTLVVPGFNDSDGELCDIARFLAGVSRDIPWHVTAFHPDYAMTDPPPTPAATLLRAVDIGRSEGLHFVYAGNLPGRTGGAESTFCPSCGTALIERRGFQVLRVSLRNGSCGNCGRAIPGVWSREAIRA